MTEVKIGEFDWEAVFQDASLLHISGITSVISEQAAEVAEYAMKEAQGRGIACSLEPELPGAVEECRDRQIFQNASACDFLYI